MSFRNKNMYLIICLLAFSFPMNGYEVANKVSNQRYPDDIKATLTMTLKDKKGRSSISKIRSITKDDGAKQIIWFLSPKDNFGVSLLKIESDDKNDMMKMWIPAFNRVRRITSKRKSDSFMGSDLSFEDLYNRALEDYTYKLISEEMFNNQMHYLIQSEPKEGVNSAYSKHVSWILKDKFIIIKEESYDKSNKLYKRKHYSYFNYTKDKESFYLIESILVENVKTNHSTELQFDDIEINSKISDDLFQEKNLKRIPR